MEFGFGPKAKAEKQNFLKQNGGYKGLKKTFRAEGGLKGGGGMALKQKVSAFRLNKGRPGQNGHLTENKKGNEPKTKDAKKPDAKKEWNKQSSEKLDKLKQNPKFFKEYNAQTKENGIKEVNGALKNKDITKLRGIVDKAMSEQNLDPQEKLAAFGFGKKEDLILSGKADEKGVFSLFKAGDTKKPFAQVQIGDKGELSFTQADNKPKNPEANKPLLEAETNAPDDGMKSILVRD